ncbi:small multidrug resistance pump [Palleronia salina]|uniref:Small multidrug resistance pump n=2 Tax=Palleronia TaxID=315422 RepID=A0A1M6ATQ2_9RHOB|nr:MULTISPECIES: multidrug efflux SMR transporter [Palleronia]SEM83711.1 small multidrug resistance pump [Palleronia pelagia]SHI39583.1 small multidrug resistance pump [Palleronia salina]
MTRAYLFLMTAIVLEVMATTALARSNSFSRLLPSILCVVGYVGSFYCLSIPIRVMPTGIIYAIWAGVGIVLITLVAWIWQGQVLDAPALAGLALILAGVVVINVFSDTLH